MNEPKWSAAGPDWALGIYLGDQVGFGIGVDYSDSDGDGFQFYFFVPFLAVVLSWAP